MCSVVQWSHKVLVLRLPRLGSASVLDPVKSYPSPSLVIGAKFNCTVTLCGRPLGSRKYGGIGALPLRLGHQKHCTPHVSCRAAYGRSIITTISHKLN